MLKLMFRDLVVHVQVCIIFLNKLGSVDSFSVRFNVDIMHLVKENSFTLFRRFKNRNNIPSTPIPIKIVSIEFLLRMEGHTKVFGCNFGEGWKCFFSWANFRFIAAQNFDMDHVVCADYRQYTAMINDHIQNNSIRCKKLNKKQHYSSSGGNK